MNTPERNDFDMSLGRLEAFSDGVFSVAVTLLALTIQVPSPPVSAAALLQKLLEQWPAYLTYFTTFTTIGMVWISHHQVLRYFGWVDETIQILNLLFLVFITLTPFTTGLLAQYIQQPEPGVDKIAVLIYGAGWLLNGLVFGLMWRYARRNHFLKPTVGESRIRGVTRGFVLSATITIMGMCVGLFNAPIGLLIYLLIGLYHASPILRIFAKPQPRTNIPSP